MKHFNNFVDGQSSEKISVVGNTAQIKINPRTGTEEFSFTQSQLLDVVLAVKSCHSAQKKWQETSFEARRLLLEKLSQLVALCKTEFVEMDSRDSGIPESDAVELFDLAHQRFVRIVQMAFASPTSFLSFQKEYQVKTPIGIIGLVLDAQQAILNSFENIAVALSCGNLVLLYPSEVAIRISLKLAQLAIEAGIPNGVFNVLLGRGEELAENILEHPGIKYIRFYGDNATGEKLNKLAAENNKRLFMSLGANNAAIVFADCDLKSSLKDILSLALRFHFFGRNKINRILVQEKVLKEFKLEFESHFKKLKFETGPLSSQYEKDKFNSYIVHSQKDRAKVFIGDAHQSFASPGYFVEPIIYEDLTNCSTLHQENLKGPVLFLQSFKYAHELGKILNSGSYAHRAYIWTEDSSRAHKLVQQIEASEIFFNSSSPLHGELSHSSLKSSGLGEEGLEALFDFNLHKKLVHLHS